MRSPPVRRSPRSMPGTRGLPTVLSWRSSAPTSSPSERPRRAPFCSRRSHEARGYAGLMPELPEVETVRARLAPALAGRRFDRVEIFDPRLTRPFEPSAVASHLEGERVTSVERRGKYLVVRFESGRSLLIHLRMTGSIQYAESGTLADDPYRRAVVKLDDGSDVAYRDVRRFGTWLVTEPGELEPYLSQRLGVEPLERGFTTAWLAGRVAGRRAPI